MRARNCHFLWKSNEWIGERKRGEENAKKDVSIDDRQCMEISTKEGK